MEIKELKSKDEFVKAFPVMKQLRTHLDEETYLDLVFESKGEGSLPTVCPL